MDAFQRSRARTLLALPFLVGAAVWGALGSLPLPLTPLAWLAALWLPGAALCRRGRIWMPLALGPVVFGIGLCLGRLLGASLGASALAIIVLSAAVLLAAVLREAPPGPEAESPPGRRWVRALPVAAGTAIFLLGALPSLVHQPLRLRDDARLHLPVIERVLAGDFPPENPFLAGEPLAYFWFYHVVLAGTSRLCDRVPLDWIPALFNAQALLVLLLAVNRFGKRLGLPPPARAAGLALVGLGFSPQGWMRLLHFQFTRPDINWALVDATGASGLFPLLAPENPRLAASLTKIAISNALPMSLALAALALAPPLAGGRRRAVRTALLVAGCLYFHVATGVLLAAGLALRWLLARATLPPPHPLAGRGAALALAAGCAAAFPYLVAVIRARSGSGAAVLELQAGEALRLHLALAGLWLCSLPALWRWMRDALGRTVLAAGLPALALPFGAHLVDGNEYKCLFFLLLLLAPAAGWGVTLAFSRIPWAVPLVLLVFAPTPFLAARAYVRETPPGLLSGEARARLMEIGRGLPPHAVLWKEHPGQGYSPLTYPLGRSFFLSDPYALQITGQWSGAEARWRRGALREAESGRVLPAFQASQTRLPDRPFVFVWNDLTMGSRPSLRKALERAGASERGLSELGLRFFVLPPVKGPPAAGLP